MLLAAGRGERMRPLTDQVPKPLLEAGGKALIIWHIEKLVRAGMTELVINHAYLGSQIEAALGDGSKFGAHIQYSAELTALDTAGGIANALPLLGKEPFAVISSDIYCDYDFACLPDRAALLKSSEDVAHLLLVDNPPHHADGDFYLHNGRIGCNLHLSPNALALTFSGISLYKPALFADITRGSNAPLAPLLRSHLDKISGEHFRGQWMDIGTPQRLAELDQLISRQIS